MISIFLPNLFGGGAERIMVNLAGGFAEAGHEVDLVVASATGPYLAGISPCVRLVDLKSSRVMWSLPKLVGYLREVRPTALVSALSHANVVAITAKWMARVKTSVVVTEHNTLSASIRSMNRWQQRGYISLVRTSYARADTVVCVSGGVADDLSENLRLANRPEVIYNPVLVPQLFDLAHKTVDLPWWWSNATPTIMAIGRLTKQKDFATLIKAFRIVRDELDCRLVILGEGEERENLERKVRTLDLTDDVFLPGFIDNPYACLAQCSLFVLSSAWEGLPTVLIEALALGIPVVSTDCNHGPREILQSGKLGALVPVGDTVSLAKAITLELVKSSDRHVKSLSRLTCYESGRRDVSLEDTDSGESKEISDPNLMPFTISEAVHRYLRVISCDDGFP